MARPARKSAVVTNGDSTPPPGAAAAVPPGSESTPAPRPLRLGERLGFRSVARLAIHPAGTRVCLHLVSHNPQLGRMRGRLMLVDTRTGGSRWLTNGPEGDGAPMFTPDGARVVFISRRRLPGQDPQATRRAIWQIACDGGEAELVIHHGTDIQEFCISRDRQWVAFTAAEDRPRSNQRLQLAPAFGSAAWRAQLGPHRAFAMHVPTRQLFRVATPPAAHVVDLDLTPDGSTLALAILPSADLADGWSGRIGLVDLPKPAENNQRRRPSLKVRMLTKPCGTRGVRFDPAGKRVVFTSTGPDLDWLTGGALGVIDLEQLPARQLATVRYVGSQLDEHLDLQGFTPDGQAALVTGPQPFAKSIGQVDLASGNARWLTQPMLAYRHVAIAAQTGDVAFVLENDRHAPALYLRGHQQAEPKRVMVIDRHQADAGGHAAHEHWAEAPDGVRTHGLRCAGASPSRPSRRKRQPTQPLMVLMHGGPMAAFSNLFGPVLEPAAVFPLRELIDIGLTCLWVNARGSTGYGRELRLAEVGGLGDFDADDVIAHIARQVAEHNADARRIVLAGWSYGGFLALATAAKVQRLRAAGELESLGLPGDFKVAGCVSGAAPSEFLSLFGSSDVSTTLTRWFGPHAARRPEKWQIPSIRDMARDVGCPVLLLHGQHDTRVPLEQAKLLYRLLKIHSSKCRLHVLPRCGHVPGEQAVIRQAHEITFQWLRDLLQLKELKADRPGPPPDRAKRTTPAKSKPRKAVGRAPAR